MVAGILALLIFGLLVAVWGEYDRYQRMPSQQARRQYRNRRGF